MSRVRYFNLAAAHEISFGWKCRKVFANKSHLIFVLETFLR